MVGTPSSFATSRTARLGVQRLARITTRRCAAVLVVAALCLAVVGFAYAHARLPKPLAQADPQLTQQVLDARADAAEVSVRASGQISALLGFTGDAGRASDDVVDTNPNQIFLTPSDTGVLGVMASWDVLRGLDGQAAALLDPEQTVLGTQPRTGWPKNTATQVTPDQVRALLSRLAQGSSRLSAALDGAISAWEQRVLAAAVADRTAAAAVRDQAVAVAQQQLSDSFGKVTDDGIRAGLAAAVDAAVALPADAPGDGSWPVSTILAQTQALAGVPDALAGPTQAVTNAQADWQAYQGAQAAANLSGDIGRWVEVSIAKQQVYLHDGASVVDTFSVSTGAPGRDTPTGSYRVTGKYPSMTYSSDKPGDEYYYPDVRWSVRFDGPYLFHTAYWHDDFGTAVSHGCVNMREAEAQVLYDFVGIGTPVVVH